MTPLSAALLVASLSGAMAFAACIAQARSGEAQSNTVIGSNAMLSDGATALQNGQWERGIQLTQLGLNDALSTDDRAAALANLCAGYAALKQFDRGLGYCDQSLAAFEGNWRAWQNRAACLIGLGRIDDALRDLQRGLRLNPDSDALQKTLAIARSLEKLQTERMQHLLES